jgi:hypothetical protein
MINILFAPRAPHPDEIAMGHYIFYRPIEEADTISVSANMGGFTPMNQAVSAIGLDRDAMTQFADSVNEKWEVGVVKHGQRRLMVIPKTRGESYVYPKRCLTTDLLLACKAEDVHTLHFCHYGFIQNKLIEEEVNRLFSIILNPLVDSQFYMDFIIEADVRIINELKSIHNMYVDRFYVLDRSKRKDLKSYV